MIHVQAWIAVYVSKPVRGTIFCVLRSPRTDDLLCAGLQPVRTSPRTDVLLCAGLHSVRTSPRMGAILCADLRTASSGYIISVRVHHI